MENQLENLEENFDEHQEYGYLDNLVSNYEKNLDLLLQGKWFEANTKELDFIQYIR